jgi:hypothetical protein
MELLQFQVELLQQIVCLLQAVVLLVLEKELALTGRLVRVEEQVGCFTLQAVL